jgi:hypothetical protein
MTSQLLEEDNCMPVLARLHSAFASAGPLGVVHLMLALSASHFEQAAPEALHSPCIQNGPAPLGGQAELLCKLATSERNGEEGGSARGAHFRFI